MGLLLLLWPRVRKAIDEDVKKWMETHAINSYEDFALVGEMSMTDKRKLLVMDPKRQVNCLVEKEIH